MQRPTLATALVAVSALATTAAAAPGAAADPADSYRAEYHFTVPDHWKNDPQRPLWLDGQFHYYYLYNADYPERIGTAWRHATSTDLVRWADQGVAAPKGTNANYDLWSGSVVVDDRGTAGFGAGAVVMMVTQMDHPTAEQIVDASGPQAQFLWYSTDRGRTFRPAGDEPVIANGGRRDFRDPKVVWDAERGQWVALVAEGDAVSVWTSRDLHAWDYRSSFEQPGLGLLECPDLFRIRADDGSWRWVLGVSANGYATGDPATFAYWTGSFDGATFHAEETRPRWLDHGFDWYGAVTWEDPTAPDDRRYAVAWMNSWAYPYTTPTWGSDGFNGTDSVVRELRLVRTGASYALTSRPVSSLQSLATGTHALGDVVVDGHLPLGYEGVAYQLEADITWEDATNVGVQLRRSAEGTRHADAGVHGDYSYLNRGGTGHPDASGERVESRAPFDPAQRRVHLRILVDRTTVEVFVDDGRQVHSSQVFAEPSDDGLALYAIGGRATFHDVRITDLAAPQQRPARVVAAFEGSTWPQGWTATGDLAQAGPTAGDLPGQVGERVADTFVGAGDAATGVLTSAPFTIDRHTLHLLVAGGRHALGAAPATSVQLLVDGRPVRTATGDDSPHLRPVAWDVRELEGRAAQLQVLDDAIGPWGHLMVDHVVLSD